MDGYGNTSGRCTWGSAASPRRRLPSPPLSLPILAYNLDNIRNIVDGPFLLPLTPSDFLSLIPPPLTRVRKNKINTKNRSYHQGIRRLRRFLLPQRDPHRSHRPHIPSLLVTSEVRSPPSLGILRRVRIDPSRGTSRGVDADQVLPGIARFVREFGTIRPARVRTDGVRGKQRW